MIEDNGDPLNPASAAYRPEYPDGAQLIAEERERQVRAGFHAENDDGHTGGELIDCAGSIVTGVLIDRGQLRVSSPAHWPTRRALHVQAKYRSDYIRRLTIAGALVAAEIDRLIRAAAIHESGPTGESQ